MYAGRAVTYLGATIGISHIFTPYRHKLAWASANQLGVPMTDKINAIVISLLIDVGKFSPCAIVLNYIGINGIASQIWCYDHLMIASTAHLS